jgi:hypothetical protein
VELPHRASAGDADLKPRSSIDGGLLGPAVIAVTALIGDLKR